MIVLEQMRKRPSGRLRDLLPRNFMSSTRARTLVALVGTIIVSACSPGATIPPATSLAAPGATDLAGDVRPVLIDTDVAPDDLVAIAFLLTSPDVEVAAITVSGTGEAHCPAGVNVVLRLLERLDAPMIDVACGRTTPIASDRAFPDAWRASVDDGSGLALPSTSRQPFNGDAVQLMAETADRIDGLRVLTLGPLTNLADALSRHPDLAQNLESVYTMGGALFVPGNVGFGGPPDNKVAEWNIYVDPTAAQTVIDSGLPVRLVSLDGTNQVPVTQAYAARVQEQSTGPGALVLAELFAGHPFMTDGSYFLWDPLAAALAAGYPLGTFSAARVEVEAAEGPEVGFTRPVEGAPNVEYLSTADRAAAEDTLLETLNGPSSGQPSVPTTPPASSPGAEIGVALGPLAPGTYRIDDPGLTLIPFSVTVPAGWTGRSDGYVYKNGDTPDEMAFFTSVVTQVYADACRSEGTLTPVGPTTDDLVRALIDQSGSDASTPVDAKLGGIPAVRVDLSIPADLDTATCRHPGELIQIWADPGESDYLAIPANPAGVMREVYIADVNGDRAVIVTAHPTDPSASDLAELDAVVDSITFEH